MASFNRRPRRPASDHYGRLGLEVGASPADVRRAYRRLAKRFHPDRAGDASASDFMDIQLAYEWINANGPPGPAARTSTPQSSTGPSWERAATTGWPGARWYWEGMRERALRRQAS